MAPQIMFGMSWLSANDWAWKNASSEFGSLIHSGTNHSWSTEAVMSTLCWITSVVFYIRIQTNLGVLWGRHQKFRKPWCFWPENGHHWVTRKASSFYIVTRKPLNFENMWTRKASPNLPNFNLLWQIISYVLLTQNIITGLVWFLRVVFGPLCLHLECWNANWQCRNGVPDDT